MKKLALCCLSVLLLCSCTQHRGSIAASAAANGIIGAGAGALIGSVLSNGNIGRSALLGGGIGVAAGVILAASSVNYSNNSAINDQQAQIEKNNEQLKSQEQVIKELRSELDEQGKAVRLDGSRKSRVYDGPTIGAYYR